MCPPRRRILRICSLAVFAAILVCIGYVSQKSRHPGPPSVQVDNPVHDFGVVRQERAFLYNSFEIRNTSSVPVKLKVAVKGCACVAVECPEEVSGNNTARVEVQVELRSLEGNFETYATLATSDPACPELPLRVRFFSIPPVVANPTCLRFSDVTRGDVLVKEFDLIVPVIDDGANSDNEWRRVSLQPGVQITPISARNARGQTKLPRRIHRFRATVDTSLLPSGSSVAMNDAIAMEVRDAPASEPLLLRVPLEVYFRHHPALRGQTTIVLSRSERDSAASLVLETHDQSTFRIDRIACWPQDEISAEGANSEPASRQTVVVRLKASGKSGVSQASVDVFAKEYPDPFRLSVLLVD